MQRSDHRHPSRRGERGFTLIEAVMVIALTGILLAVVGRFIVAPVQAYLSVSARAGLTDAADGALRRIGRDLRGALPNSARTSADGLSLEFIPVSGMARYSTGGSDPLLFGTLDSSFNLIGPGLTLSSGQQLVFYNLGTGVVGSDAYAANSSATEQASANRRGFTNAAGSASTINLSSLAGLPVAALAAPYRVALIDPPVTYHCDLSARTLTRHAGYGFLATQAGRPSSGSSQLLATGVTACRFSVDNAVVAARAGLVMMSLTLTTATPTADETVSLHHAVHVDNLP